MTENNIQPLDREQFLAKNIIDRENEILVYQINIANFEWAIENGDFTDPDPVVHQQLEDHRQFLIQCLSDSKREMRKSEMILAALQAQLQALQNEG